MAHNIRKATTNKKHESNVAGNNVTTSAVGYNDISRTPRSNVKNEFIGYLDDADQTKQIVEQDAIMVSDDLSEDEIYWDNNLLDILQVECNEGSNPMQIFDDTSTNFGYKIYEIENSCAICYKKFSYQRDLVQHAKHTHPGEKAFKCQHCHTIFSKVKSVTAHFKRIHADLNSRKEANNNTERCQVERHAGLRSNDDSFSNRRGKIYPIENKCAVCDRTFSYQSDLVKHTQQEHPNDKAYKCLYCTTIFSKLKSISSHYKRSHCKLNKTICCDICNMTFYTQFLLERHRSSHTEQRPFACHQCDNSYKYKWNMLVHMKTHSKDGISVDTNEGEDFMDEYCESDDQTLFTRDQCMNDENLISEDENGELKEESLLRENEEGGNISKFSSAEGSNLNQQYQYKSNESDGDYKQKNILKPHDKTDTHNNESTDFNRSNDNIDGRKEATNTTKTCSVEKDVTVGIDEFNDNTFSSRNEKIYLIENKCAICDRTFSFQNDLVNHTQQEHPNDKVYKCLYCPTLFSQLKSVPTHYRRSHSKLKKTYMCDICNMKFFTQFLLDRHRRSHTEQRPFVCNQCNKNYKYKRNLLVHMKTHSKNDKSKSDKQNLVTRDRYCVNKAHNLKTEDDYGEMDEQSFEDDYGEMDDQSFLTENEEGINISEFSSPEGSNLNKQYPLRSNECDRVYYHKKELHQERGGYNNESTNELTETIIVDDTSTNHQVNVNFDNSTYFIIDELNTDSEHFEDFGEEFATTNYTDEYYYEDYDAVNTQNFTDDKQNECGICQKVFKCQQSVAKHLQRCHAEIEFFKCPYCDDNLYSLDSLSQHIIIKKHPQKRHICKTCLKSFDRMGDLKRHIRIHTDERPYSCNICHKKYKQTNHLKRHTELNHNASRQLKYSCDLCLRSFQLEETLKRHMNIHDRERKFPCSMCSKIFKTRYDWQRHERTHSSRKYLACEYCLKSFDNMQTLNLHIRGHTGERKYLCTMCKKTFKEKSHLVSHRKFHENSKKQDSIEIV